MVPSKQKMFPKKKSSLFYALVFLVCIILVYMFNFFINTRIYIHVPNQLLPLVSPIARFMSWNEYLSLTRSEKSVHKRLGILSEALTFGEVTFSGIEILGHDKGDFPRTAIIADALRRTLGGEIIVEGSPYDANMEKLIFDLSDMRGTQKLDIHSIVLLPGERVRMALPQGVSSGGTQGKIKFIVSAFVAGVPADFLDLSSQMGFGVLDSLGNQLFSSVKLLENEGKLIRVLVEIPNVPKEVNSVWCLDWPKDAKGSLVIIGVSQVTQRKVESLVLGQVARSELVNESEPFNLAGLAAFTEGAGRFKWMEMLPEQGELKENMQSLWELKSPFEVQVAQGQGEIFKKLENAGYAPKLLFIGSDACKYLDRTLPYSDKLERSFRNIWPKICIVRKEEFESISRFWFGGDQSYRAEHDNEIAPRPVALLLFMTGDLNAKVTLGSYVNSSQQFTQSFWPKIYSAFREGGSKSRAFLIQYFNLLKMISLNLPSPGESPAAVLGLGPLRESPLKLGRSKLFLADINDPNSAGRPMVYTLPRVAFSNRLWCVCDGRENNGFLCPLGTRYASDLQCVNLFLDSLDKSMGSLKGSGLRLNPVQSTRWQMRQRFPPSVVDDPTGEEKRPKPLPEEPDLIFSPHVYLKTSLNEGKIKVRPPMDLAKYMRDKTSVYDFEQRGFRVDNPSWAQGKLVHIQWDFRNSQTLELTVTTRFPRTCKGASVEMDFKWDDLRQLNVLRMSRDTNTLNEWFARSNKGSDALDYAIHCLFSESDSLALKFLDSRDNLNTDAVLLAGEFLKTLPFQGKQWGGEPGFLKLTYADFPPRSMHLIPEYRDATNPLIMIWTENQPWNLP